MSFLEGVFSRGDRRLAGLLHAAWKNGARLDAWSDYFDLGIWRRAAEQEGLDLEDYLRKREMTEILPWQHLQSGVELSFLQAELENAHRLVYTPDCRYHGCQDCGVCDFKSIRPIVHGKETPGSVAAATDERPLAKGAAKTTVADELHLKYLVTYQRLGDICYRGHLEILQLIFRALRRAGITTNFSQGFNPSPKISFGPALPVGMESLAEYFIMDLPAPLPDPEKTALLLDAKLPDGLTILTVSLHSGRISQDTLNTYRIVLPEGLTGEEVRLLEVFRAADRFLVIRDRKGKSKEIDIRPLIRGIEVEGDDTIILRIISRAGAPGVKVLEAMQYITGRNEARILAAHMQKTGWSPLAGD
jgi:radical SAM-linked protein